MSQQNTEQSNRIAVLREALIRYEDAGQATKIAEAERIRARDALADIIGVPRFHGDASIVYKAKARIGELVVIEGRRS